MKEPDPVGADARKAAHLRKLGRPPHICAFCGFADPLRLKAKPLDWVKARVPPSTLQKHHVVGERHDGRLIVLLCANCHLLVHRRYLDDGIDLRSESDSRKRVAQMLRARATYAELEADCWRDWADQLDYMPEKPDERKDH
jgi:hypothetical protein